MLTYLTTDDYSSSDFEYIYRKYKNTVYAIIYKYVQDVELANDTMQETFVRLYKTMGKLQAEDDVRRWLFKVAKNVSLDCIQKDSRYKSKIEVWLDDDKMATDFLDITADNPLDEVLKLELAKQVSEVLETLKPIHADVIRLKYYFGYSPDEIAQITKAPVHTVYSRLEKARRLLLAKLSFIKEESSQLVGGVFHEKK